MASTNPQPDDGPAPPLLPFTGIDSDHAFDLPYAVDPSAHDALPSPPDPPSPAGPATPAVIPADPAPPPPPPRPTAPAPPAAATASGRPRADDPGPTTAEPTLREPRPFLPPNFSTPHRATAPTPTWPGSAPPPSVRPDRAPDPAPAPATLPPPLSAQPLSGPVVPAGDDPPENDDTDPTGALPPMVAARTFEAPATGPAPAPVSPPAGDNAALPNRTEAASPASPAPSTDGQRPVDRSHVPPILSRRRAAEAPPAPAPPPPGPGGPAPTGPLTMSPDAPFPTAPPAPAPATSGPIIAPLVPGAPPLPPAPAGPTTAEVAGPRVADGTLVGLAAAALAGAVWWAVVTLTQRQVPYLAVLLGLLVGHGVLVGARRGSLALGALAGVLTLVSLSAAQYFISRSLAISELGLDIPLWNGAGAAVDEIRATYQDDGLTAVFVVLATGCAAVAAGRPSARPVT